MVVQLISPQRLRWFEYKNFPVEVILLGKGNAFDPEAKKAEAAVFHLLDDIHLRERNPQLYVDLVRLRSPERLGPGYDWYLPDRRRILEAFWKLCRGSTPRFVGVQKQPAFERFTKLYPAYATPDQIFNVVNDA
ncbi:MAG: hypothetical protein DMG92_16480 [Acidobacteria bacterium]|nr:MAG: hypothetical protein DMG92_16480 [Acidobacteriota bacterium]